MRPLQMVTVGAVVLGLTGGGLHPVSAGADSAEPSSTIVYYGTTEAGKFFQTNPLDAQDPRNLNVSRPDRDLPLDPYAHGVVTAPTGVAGDGSLFATCWITVNPVGFDLTRRTMFATVDQSCSEDVRTHGAWSRFDRTGPNGWVPYSHVQWLGDSPSHEPWTFLHEEGCQVGQGRFDYAQNATGQAITDDGRTITGSATPSGPTGGDCGRGVSP